MSRILFLTSAAPLRAGFSTSEKRPPLGLGYLMATLKKLGHKVFFSDEYLKPTSILDGSFLSDNGIDNVGIYSNTICYESTLQMFEKIQNKRDRNEWNGKILVGGPHTSVGLDSIPEYVDHIIIGEGEVTVPKIIENQDSSRIISGEKVKDLDLLPFPAWEEFVYRNYDYKNPWTESYPVYTMNTSRGCPYNCTFCSVRAIWGETYRYMSAERIINDIELMIRLYGAKGIYFREDNFTFSKKRVIEFCELLLKKNIEIEWFCETRADQLNDYGCQKLMKDSGCKAFYIGVESGSPKMLELFNKGETVEQFISAFDIAKRVGIKTYASFVVGVPMETKKDRILTEQLIERIKPDFIGNNVYVGLPGSQLYDEILNNKLYEHEDEFHILYPNGYLNNIYRYYTDSEYFKVYKDNRESGKIKKTVAFTGEIPITKSLSLKKVSFLKIDEDLFRFTFDFNLKERPEKNYTIYFHGFVDEDNICQLPLNRRDHGFENWDFSPSIPTSSWTEKEIKVSTIISVKTNKYVLKMGFYDLEKTTILGNEINLGEVFF